MRRLLSALFVGAAVLVSGAFVNADAAVKKGDKEFSVSGVITHDKNQTSFTGIAGFGGFLTDNVEVKGQIIALTINPDPGSNAVAVGLAGQGLYYFNPKEKTVFYAGAGFGYVKVRAGGFDDSASLLQLVAGAKHFLTDRTTVFAELDFNEIFFSGDRLTQTQLLVGLSYFF